MIDRKIFKRVLYNFLISNTDLVTYYLTYVDPALVTLEPYVAESGVEFNSTDFKFPAIRFQLAEKLEKFCDIDDTGFYIYIYSAQPNTDESDAIMDIIRSIFSANNGRALGIFSELLAGNEFMGWNVKLVASDQRKTPDQPPTMVIGGRPGGERWINVLKFHVDIASFI